MSAIFSDSEFLSESILHAVSNTMLRIKIDVFFIFILLLTGYLGLVPGCLKISYKEMDLKGMKLSGC
jgi:hypothetical protein